MATRREPVSLRRSRQEMPVRISARTDYALRAAAELAAANGDVLVKADRIAQAQGIPLKFLLNIMNELKQGEIVRSRRGSEGGYRLARPVEAITLGDVVRAVEGRLSTVREAPPDEVFYGGPAEGLREVWINLQTAVEGILDSVTLADLVRGAVPLSP